MTDPERRAYPRGERSPRDDEREHLAMVPESLVNVRVFTAEVARRKAKVWIGTMLIFGVASFFAVAVGPEWLRWCALPFTVCLVRGSYWTGRLHGIREGLNS